MIENINNSYSGARVRIDNQIFKNCIFSNCVIEYAAEGPISLSGCTFNNCQWVFVGAAQSTLNFMQTMYHSMGDFGRGMIESTFDNIKNAGAPESGARPEEAPIGQEQSDV